MKRFKLAVASLAIAAGAFVFAPSDALAQQRPGLYGSVSVGGLFVNDQDYSDLDITAEYETGFVFSAAIGNRFGNGFRAEAEFSYGMTGFDSFSTSGGSASVSGADVNLFSFTAGGFYDFNIGGAFTPYLGGGVGFVHTSIDDGTFSGPVSGTIEGDSGTDLTAFGEAGLAFALSQNVEIVPAYRFQWFDVGGDGVDDVTAHIVKVGLRFGF